MVLSSHFFFSPQRHTFISSFQSITQPIHTHGVSAYQAPGAMLGTKDTKNDLATASKKEALLVPTPMGRLGCHICSFKPWQTRTWGKNDNFSRNFHILSFKETWT